tara:strand:- start:12 stop:959 length:948 start_codon:yes stop_codon:yes gene_type:complete
MEKILVTGASGFIGNNLCNKLIELNFNVRGAVRTLDSLTVDYNFNAVTVGEIGANTNWKNALKDIDCIINCAGKAHLINKKNNANLYHLINTEGTKNLAEQAVKAGVKRLILLSSVKVNGESTDQITKHKFSHKNLSNPQDPYAISKLEAEKVLWKISLRTGLEVVVVRLPLVYGNGAKGNLARLIKLVKLGIPLPLGMIDNQRSMIGIDNLVDLLIHCIDHPEASGKTFLTSDGEDISTPELIKLIASSMGKKANLFPLPIFILKFLGTIFGKSEEINRLTGSLRIDNNYTKEILNWTPPVSVEEGIRRMVQGK